MVIAWCRVMPGCSHPPHGGCGLKYMPSIAVTKYDMRHPPHGGCGLKLYNTPSVSNAQ